MKNITTLNTEGRKFYIVQNDDGFYCAIEDKFVDENGKLTQKLNGLQMNANKNVADCINQTMSKCRIDTLVKNGMDVTTAIQKVILGIG